ncbi:hypothetical protein N656DRAFT_802189 [Canariomyces notabilis]|uniref:Uncharacterized protein n=1 Tax=Canariomyces notabilis TaxID=2074819 RepID=A0AAN6QDE5_9PEZI|nr:hypothetical protein N656DRAFT_802189 [Canariomyces arenarius]
MDNQAYQELDWAALIKEVYGDAPAEVPAEQTEPHDNMPAVGGPNGESEDFEIDYATMDPVKLGQRIDSMFPLDEAEKVVEASAVNSSDTACDGIFVQNLPHVGVGFFHMNNIDPALLSHGNQNDGSLLGAGEFYSYGAQPLNNNGGNDNEGASDDHPNAYHGFSYPNLMNDAVQNYHDVVYAQNMNMAGGEYPVHPQAASQTFESNAIYDIAYAENLALLAEPEDPVAPQAAAPQTPGSDRDADHDAILEDIIPPGPAAPWANANDNNMSDAPEAADDRANGVGLQTCTSCGTNTTKAFRFWRRRPGLSEFGAQSGPPNPLPYCLDCADRTAVAWVRARPHRRGRRPLEAPGGFRAAVIKFLLDGAHVPERLLVADRYLFCRGCLDPEAMVGTPNDVCDTCLGTIRCDDCGRCETAAGRLTGHRDGSTLCHHCAAARGRRRRQALVGI